MALNWRTLRSLIYSFQLDAASAYLNEHATADDVPRKLVTRLRKAITYTQSSHLLAAGPFAPKARGSVRRPVGRWWTLWPMENRLRIKGAVRAECTRVGIFINDRLVKLVNTAQIPDDRRKRRVFRFNVKEDILRVLPAQTVLGVGSEFGYLEHREGGLTYRHPALSGDSSLFRLLRKSHFLNKKGRLQRRLDLDEGWKQAALRAYKEFREYFERRFGYKPFVVCGTLLGWYRDSDFIAYDDDMDVAYFSNARDPMEIKEELKCIVYRMLSDGYDIKLARKPGFFKPCIDGFWFDVFPLWFDQQCLWMMNTTRQRTGPDAILPLRLAHFRGVDVYVPRDPERYLEMEYGPNWRIPDPGYRSIAAPGTSEYLSRSCISDEEIRELYLKTRKLATQQTSVGHLSIADRDIDALL